MTAPSDAGRHVELVFPDGNCVISVDASETDAELSAETLLDALRGNADDAETLLSSAVGEGRVERRG